MAHIDRAYVIVAFALLLAGEFLDLYMGIASDLRYRSLHTVMVLPGFVTLAIFGFEMNCLDAYTRKCIAERAGPSSLRVG